MIMEIDKQNGSICFSEKEHVYWDKDNENDRYVSVTTLIHSFTQPFDKDFWSAYKALEKLIPKEYWPVEKKGLLNTKKIDKEILSVYDISENSFNKTQQDILDEWDKKNKDSCERGTKIHSELENQYYKKPKNISLQKYGIGGKFECKKGYTPLDMECGIYPEYLIYRKSDDGYLKIAGQIDLLVKNGNDIWIIDYKTNQSIDMKSGFDTKTKRNATMQYPLNNLQDCNYYHYTLQLSTYALMIQKMNPEFNIKGLILVHYGHDGNVTQYKLDYLKSDVERMLAYHKKEVIKQRQRERRKRVEY